MSADNWAVCPKCLDDAQKASDALQAEMDASYGKIPLNEFDELRSRADADIDMDKITTFREDYEFWGADEGVVHVSYSGHCGVCGTKCNFKEEHLFYPVPSP